MTKLLLSLRLRGLLRAGRQNPWRSALFSLLWLASLLGATALFHDVFIGFASLPPTEDALLLAPQGAATSYVIWRQMIFWATILLSMPSCYRVMRDLYHRPEWRSYAVLPIDPGAIYNEASVLGGLFGLFWWSLSATLSVPLFLVGDLTGGLSSLLFVTFLFVFLHLLAPFVHSYAGALAVDPASRQMLGPLSGAWVSAEATPFLYAPAAVLGGLGFGSIPLQRAIETALFGVSSGAWVALGAGLALSVYLFIRGRGLYREAFAKVLPTLREAEALLYGGSSIERGVPYGVFLAPLVSKEAWPWLLTDLYALGRIARARWLQLAVFVGAGSLFLLRIESVPSWFIFAACAASMWLGSIGLLLGEETSSPHWLRRSFPVAGSSIVLARCMASIFFALHAGLPLSLALYAKESPDSWMPLVASFAAGFLGGGIPDILFFRRSHLSGYAMLCAISLALGRLWTPLIGLSLLGFALLTFLIAKHNATAPEAS
jgi:hypothetical protein